MAILVYWLEPVTSLAVTPTTKMRFVEVVGIRKFVVGLAEGPSIGLVQSTNRETCASEVVIKNKFAINAIANTPDLHKNVFINESLSGLVSKMYYTIMVLWHHHYYMYLG